ncbi:regulator of chromosome condensation 1/beta-lactamase-inhibitor protein II [Mycena rebaudengoi]|nr:regulator of chromosome condensation 1/beta-lactamase-inhibitor protein II [Mycena rebaudengoi]
MLRGFVIRARPIRLLHTAAHPSASSRGRGLAASSALLASMSLWFYTRPVVHNDTSTPFVPQKTAVGTTAGDSNQNDTLNTLVWGSNRSNLLSGLLPSSTTIKRPFAAAWLENVALRDMALHQNHAACVDARGDVYQWGEGHAPRTLEGGKPRRTLSGKDIIKLQLSDRRVFALSKSGRVYVLDSDASEQTLSAPPPHPWWRFWATSQLVGYAELRPDSTFGWGEKFVSISCGTDHLLALTSTGRTFSSPVTKKGNAYGQLGFNAPDPQETSSLYEIPVLRGVQVAQVAAGAYSSFVRTPSGQVLAWGANDHGQLGLGAKPFLSVVTVPTEVLLAPTKSLHHSTRCLDVSAGGNLTCFTIERAQSNEPPTVDVLVSGDGQWGVGNSAYSNAQVTPARVKTISGVVEYNEATQRLQCVLPHSISISRSGHVLATLNPLSGGRDLYAWGRNQDYEVGNGKKTSVPAPIPVEAEDGLGRVLLQKRRAKEVRDLEGRIWGRGVAVEQRAIGGSGSSIIYWSLGAPLS